MVKHELQCYGDQSITIYVSHIYLVEGDCYLSVGRQPGYGVNVVPQVTLTANQHQALLRTLLPHRPQPL